MSIEKNKKFAYALCEEGRRDRDSKIASALFSIAGRFDVGGYNLDHYIAPTNEAGFLRFAFEGTLMKHNQEHPECKIGESELSTEQLSKMGSDEGEKEFVRTTVEAVRRVYDNMTSSEPS